MSIITLLVLINLVVIPMVAFFIIRRIFRVFRLIKNGFGQIVMPYLENLSKEDADGVQPIPEDENGHSYYGQKFSKVKLNDDQLDLLRKSFFNKSVEVNPKKFQPKTKKRLAVLGIVAGVSALAVVAFKVFWVIYDFIVLTYF